LTTALKRLASAVQLRPWPPCFQQLEVISQSKRLTQTCGKMGLSWVDGWMRT
jgi:hypothetical protein